MNPVWLSNFMEVKKEKKKLHGNIAWFAEGLLDKTLSQKKLIINNNSSKSSGKIRQQLL